MHIDLKSKLGMYSQQNKVKENKSRGTDIHDLLQGNICNNDHGCYFMLENQYPLTHLHGGYNLGSILGCDISPIMKVCNQLSKPLCITDLAFLDTETTGLSGGTGTVAFLIGIGFFTNDAFVLRQYFMRDYDEEPAMLTAINELLTSYKGLVTFNGKAFDWNLLQTRYISNRFRLALKNPVHVDLLYPSRTLWRLKLESCRLVSLEENILKEIRVDDIPGALIPAIYFKYLEDRNATQLVKVMKHNELDILSMVSLMVKINSILSNPLSEAEDNLELLGAGKIFEKHEEHSSAIDCYNECTLSEDSHIKEMSLKKLALMYKRNKDFDKAVEQYMLILENSNTPNIPIMIELAKHYEHRVKDILKALDLVQQAFNACSQAAFLRNLYYKDLKARLERLKKKAMSQGTVL